MEQQLSETHLARLREIFDRIPYVRLLGMELVGIARGEARIALELREELTRNEGLMHGGAIASLMDSASAFAVMSMLEPGQSTVTIDLTIHFLRPVLRGRIEARARVLRAGHHIATLSIDTTDEAGKLTATATTTYLILTETPAQTP